MRPILLRELANGHERRILQRAAQRSQDNKTAFRLETPVALHGSTPVYLEHRAEQHSLEVVDAGWAVMV